MSADDVIVTYIFTGEEERNEDGLRRYIIPQNVTHLIFHESVTVIPARLFQFHPNIVEVYCHAGVKRIEVYAFWCCPRLRRIIIPGVEVVESEAFQYCLAVADIECPKLERIGERAFQACKSLRGINLPSAKVVEKAVFCECPALTDVKFDKHLESIDQHTFWHCPSLERITIPLKNGLISHVDAFLGCRNLKRVDLAEGAVLHDLIAALQLEEWRYDMNAVIDSINYILQHVPTGHTWHTDDDDSDDDYEEEEDDDVGAKVIVILIRGWIGDVLRKIIHYKAKHRQLLNETATALQRALPNDIAMNNVIPFLELPMHTFDGENEEGGG